MKLNSTFKSLGVAALVCLGAGCAQEGAGGQEVVEAEPAADVAAPAATAPAGAAAGGAVAGGAAAGNRGDFATWDTNADGTLDNNEFRTRFNDGGWYGDWDGDRNGALTNEEFTAVNTTWGTAPEGVDANGLFETWDADRNGALVADEAATGAFSTWDRDRNNLIDNNEFNAGLNWFGR